MIFLSFVRSPLVLFCSRFEIDVGSLIRQISFRAVFFLMRMCVINFDSLAVSTHLPYYFQYILFFYFEFMYVDLHLIVDLCHVRFFFIFDHSTLNYVII